jgi:hypothetical protein
MLFSLSAAHAGDDHMGMTQAAYAQALGDVATALSSDLSASDTSKPGATERALLPLGSVSVWKDPNDHVIVDNRPLEEMLKEARELPSATDRKQALRSLLQSVNASQVMAANVLPSHEVRTNVADILSGNTYASDPVPPPSVVDKVIDWLQNKLKALHWKPASGKPWTVSQKVVNYVFYGLVIAIVAIIVAFIVNYVMGMEPRRVRAVPQTNLATTAEEASLIAGRNHQRLLEMAGEAAGAGEYRNALRLTYLSALVHLESEGIIRLVRSATNWDYNRVLRDANHPTAPLFEPLTRDFDRFWYGVRPASESDYQRSLGLVRQLADTIAGLRTTTARGRL